MSSSGVSQSADLGAIAANTQHVKGSSSGGGDGMPTHASVGVAPHHVMEDAPKDHLHVGDTALSTGDFQDQVHVGKQAIPTLGENQGVQVPLVEGDAFTTDLNPGNLTPANLPADGLYMAGTVQTVGNTEAAKGFSPAANLNAEADHGIDVGGALSSGGGHAHG
jgi:hypothetical protein